jgi:hypothetical protein
MEHISADNLVSSVFPMVQASLPYKDADFSTQDFYVDCLTSQYFSPLNIKCILNNKSY